MTLDSEALHMWMCACPHDVSSGVAFATEGTGVWLSGWSVCVGCVGDIHSVSNFDVPETAVSVSHGRESVSGGDAGGEDVGGIFGVNLGLHCFPAPAVDTFGCCRTVFGEGVVEMFVHMRRGLGRKTGGRSCKNCIDLGCSSTQFASPDWQLCGHVSSFRLFYHPQLFSPNLAS